MILVNQHWNILVLKIGLRAKSFFLLHVNDFIVCISKVIYLYWLDTDDFFKSWGKNTEKINEGISSFVFQDNKSPLVTKYSNLTTIGF